MLMGGAAGEVVRLEQRSGREDEGGDSVLSQGLSGGGRCDQSPGLGQLCGAQSILHLFPSFPLFNNCLMNTCYTLGMQQRTEQTKSPVLVECICQLWGRQLKSKI